MENSIFIAVNKWFYTKVSESFPILEPTVTDRHHFFKIK